MRSYPIHTLSTPDQQLNVLQITDLHLSLHDATSVTNNNVVSAFNCQQKFEAILQQALSENIRCDLILVTGDLVDEVHPDIYAHIFAVLQATTIPFACIAGNHDVTNEVGKDLPFYQRTLVAKSADARLLSRHVIDTEHWQLLLLNTAVSGKVAGEITLADIEWLHTQLTDCHKPALLAIHHHVLPMHSEWIDNYMADNADIFWQRMAGFDHLRVIISGHTHQEHTLHCQGVTVYSTPSTCYQFKPYEDEFSYDDAARPGYRWLQLANNGQVASWVKRLDT